MITGLNEQEVGLKYFKGEFMSNDFRKLVLGKSGSTKKAKAKKARKSNLFSFGKSNKSEKEGNAWLNKIRKQAKW